MTVTETVAVLVVLVVAVVVVDVAGLFTVHYGLEHLACIETTAWTPYGGDCVCPCGFSPAALVASALCMPQPPTPTIPNSFLLGCSATFLFFPLHHSLFSLLTSFLASQNVPTALQIPLPYSKPHFPFRFHRPSLSPPLLFFLPFFLFIHFFLSCLHYSSFFPFFWLFFFGSCPPSQTPGTAWHCMTPLKTHTHTHTKRGSLTMWLMSVTVPREPQYYAFYA